MRKNILFGTPKWNDWISSIINLKNTKNIKNIYLNDLNNINDILNLIKNNEITLIIPCTFEQMKFLTENKIENAICNDSHNKIELFDNKYKFINFVISNNMADVIPIVYKMKNDGITKILTENYKFPVIYKYPVAYAGEGSKVCHSIEEIDLIINSSQNDYIIQEYIINNIEYGGHMFVKDGYIKYSIYYSIKNDDKYYIQYGKMQNYVRVLNFKKEYELIFENIFKTINFTGFVCINFKIINDSVKIFEINPRFGGTLLSNRKDFAEMMENVIKFY